MRKRLWNWQNILKQNGGNTVFFVEPKRIKWYNSTSEVKMPVHKVLGGWKFGKSGKVYKSKSAAERQAKAIYASGWREK